MSAAVDTKAIREEALVEMFRQHLREAFHNKAVGEMNIRLQFKDGVARQTKIGMKVEYEFLENSKNI